MRLLWESLRCRCNIQIKAMLQGDPSPPKILTYSASPRFGDFWTLRKRSKTIGDSNGDLLVVPKTFQTDFRDAFGRFQGFSGQISGIFWEFFRDNPSTELQFWQSWILMIEQYDQFSHSFFWNALNLNFLYKLQLKTWVLYDEFHFGFLVI